jgi:hypothetical protein
VGKGHLESKLQGERNSGWNFPPCSYVSLSCQLSSWVSIVRACKLEKSPSLRGRGQGGEMSYTQVSLMKDEARRAPTRAYLSTWLHST